MRSLRLSQLVSLLYAVAILATPLAAQTPPPYVNQSNETGLPAHGSFMSSDIDNVNLANGALHVQIGLYAGKMRGDFSNAEGVRYESKFWTMSNQTAYLNNNSNLPYLQYYWSADADNAGWQDFGGRIQYGAEFTSQSLTCQILNPCGTSDPNNPTGCPLAAFRSGCFYRLLAS